MKTTMKYVSAALLFVAISMVLSSGCDDDTRYSVEVTDDTFDALVLKASGPVLVMFYLPWCPHCQAMEQPVEDLAKDMAAELKVAKLEASENPSTSQRYKISGVPKFIMFKNGNATASAVGEMSKTELYDWTRNALNSK